MQLSVFISYSHTDMSYRQQLHQWLVELRSKGLINEWSDAKLVAGDHVMNTIAAQIDAADIILLLLSQDYLASENCRAEMSYALSVADRKRVISIILRDCTWKDTGCGRLLALPKDGKPLADWEPLEHAWKSVYEGLKLVIEKMRSTFTIQDEFLKDLQHVEFVTQKSETSLADIFVFPNVYRETGAFKREVLDAGYFTRSDTRAAIVRGRELSGKTSLLRWLYLSSPDDNRPIFLDGNDIHKTRQFDAHLRREFNRQLTGDFERWFALGNKVVLIDNYNHKISENLMPYLKEHFVKIFVTMDDEEFMLYFKDDATYSDFAVLSLGQITLEQQEILIRKWAQFGLPRVNGNELDDLVVDKLEAKVNNAITTSRIVPRYPFYVLSILQSLEAFMPTDYQVTAYGHCYQALVTARLIKKNIKAEDLDTCFNYLKLLSADIFLHTKGDALYTAMDYRAFRASYKENYIIEDALIHKMENDDYPILTLEQERAGFEYEYLYYFFLGMHIANEDTLEAVGLLCDDIQVRQNAFVLIFAVHHSHRRELLNLIRGRLADAFKNTRPAELSVDETKFMEKLVAELPTSILSISSTADNRRKQRRGQEAALEAESAESDKAASSPNTHEGEGPDLGQIYRGLRSIEVLGQIVRNRAGSYERREVAEILENTVDLGLRILAVLLRDLRDPEFQASLAELLREAERGREESGRDVLREAEKRDFVEKNIQWAAYVITVGMLNRISGAVGSEKLMGVLSDAANRRATPAYELVDFLVSLSQSGIDQRATKGLMTRYEKTKNYWAAKTLSYYVQMWLNTHAIQDRIRQSILSTLGIKYLPRSS